MGSNNRMLGPFFADTDTYQDFHQHNEPNDKIWGNENKVKIMKSIWGQDPHNEPWGSNSYGLQSLIGIQETMRRSESESSIATRSVLTEPLRRSPNFFNYARPGNSIAADPFTDDLLSKKFPKVGSPPRDRAFSFPNCIEEREIDETSAKFELEFEGSNDGAWGFDPIPSARSDSTVSRPSSDALDFFSKPNMGRKFSLDSLGSDGMSKTSLQSFQDGRSSASNDLSLSRSDMDTLSNFLQDEDEEQDIAARFDNACRLGNNVMSKPRPGSTRADLEDFSRKFGYAGQPRTSLMYRPRKGKYRKEF